MSAFRGRSYQALPEPGDADDSELKQLHPQAVPDNHGQHEQRGVFHAFHFSKKSQLVRLLKPSLFRCFLSLLLSAALVGLLQYFGHKSSLDRRSQAKFFISTSIVLLALAANIQVNLSPWPT